MEVKYLYIIAIFTFFIILSSMVGSDKDEVIADPIENFYALEANLISGETIKMDRYKGKKILIVNVASKCGLTPQYTQLEKLYKEFSDKIVVLGFPSNQFLGQEPGENKDIASFCSSKYSVTFPLFEKTNVKGSKKHPIYEWLSNKKHNGWNKKSPSWNFTKYLIDENGKLIKRISPRTSPMSNEIISLLK